MGPHKLCESLQIVAPSLSMDLHVAIDLSFRRLSRLFMARPAINNALACVGLGPDVWVVQQVSILSNQDFGGVVERVERVERMERDEGNAKRCHEYTDMARSPDLSVCTIFPGGRECALSGACCDQGPLLVAAGHPRHCSSLRGRSVEIHQFQHLVCLGIDGVAVRGTGDCVA